ncbi:hypothetical protein BKA56DRAFT_506076 [Ilyonectria sp. MPI-CAGE-AT-0026]|nr:hypothetical protein BKA56DRAFT_506076 [Ilyonectria sp. MPI-CAGE-AT-0026]
MLLYCHRASGTLPHARKFLNHTCNKIALLYENVPYLANTWMECMGDLARCGMAFEEGEDEASENWRIIGCEWYSRLSRQSPTTGRFYFHLAVVTTDDCLRRLFYYIKSLCAQDPFPSESDSVAKLFRSTSDRQFHEVDAAFVRAHIILSSGKGHEKEFYAAIGVVLNGLNGRIEEKGTSWQEAGCFMAIATACSVLVYGGELNVLSRAMSKSAASDIATEGKSIPEGNFSRALSFAIRTQALVLGRRGDENTLPFFYTSLVFLDHLTRFPAAMRFIATEYPWGLTASMLNSLGPCSEMERASPDQGESLTPLPEDYAMQGLTWVKDHHSDGFFDNEISEDMKDFGPSLRMAERKKRVISLGRTIVTRGTWLTVNADTGEFSVSEGDEKTIEKASMRTGKHQEI